MAANANVIAARLLAKGQDGRPLPAVSGEETDEQLRQLVFDMSGKCPVGKNHPHCPFNMLGGLSRTSLRTFVTAMNRQALLNLFDLERNCRCQPHP
jgi:hypothetical protein